MRKNKKIFACLFIGIGILLLPFSLIKGFPAAFILSAGCVLIAYGIVDFLFEHFIHKIGRAKIMDEDERNVLINGKAYTLVSEFANIGFICFVFRYLQGRYGRLHDCCRYLFIKPCSLCSVF